MKVRYAHPTPDNKRKEVSVLADVFRHREKGEELDFLQSQEKISSVDPNDKFSKYVLNN